MKLEITEEQSWSLIVVGLILLGVSMIGFAWAMWPDGFTGLVGTIWDLLTDLLRISYR